MNHSYWQRQVTGQPLFPDIEWSRPEQKSNLGKLGIVGGNKLGFISVAESYQTALKTGIGEVRVLLPLDLKKAVPTIISDVIYGPSNLSGGLNRDSLGEMGPQQVAEMRKAFIEFAAKKPVMAKATLPQAQPACRRGARKVPR